MNQRTDDRHRRSLDKSFFRQLIRAVLWQWISVVAALAFAEGLVLPAIDKKWLWTPIPLERDTLRSVDLAVYLLTYLLLSLIINVAVVSGVSYKIERLGRKAVASGALLSTALAFYVYLHTVKHVIGLLPVEIGWPAISVYVLLGLVGGGLLAPRPRLTV